jgi:hypothetical protein
MAAANLASGIDQQLAVRRHRDARLLRIQVEPHFITNAQIHVLKRALQAQAN